MRDQESGGSTTIAQSAGRKGVCHGVAGESQRLENPDTSANG